MQASDTLDRIRTEIDARLDELRPRVQEYGTIEAAARSLSDSASGARGPRPRRTRKPSTHSRPRAARRRAPSSPTPSARASRRIGPNQAAIVKVLGEKATPAAPLTARELADATRLAPTTVYGALQPLTERGVVRVIKQSAGSKAFTLAGRASPS